MLIQGLRMFESLEKYSNFLCTSLILGFLFVTLPSVGLAKQQTVLLDANGKPLSNEVLSLLSSGASLLTSKKKAAATLPNTTNKNRKANKQGVKKNTSFSTPELEEELLYALKDGKTARAKHLIKKGVKVNYKNSMGETPIAVAVKKAWASMVLELLENGADIHQKGPRGVTLLHDASSRGLTDISKLLIKHGLNPATKTDKKWTSLHVAARYGHWELVRLFVQMGVDPDIRNSDGKTALELAQQLRHHGVVKILSPVTTARPYAKLLRKRAKRKKRK